MLTCPRGETADYVYHGIAIIIIIIRVARCNDRIRRQFPGTKKRVWGCVPSRSRACRHELLLLVPRSHSLS